MLDFLDVVLAVAAVWSVFALALVLVGFATLLQWLLKMPQRY